MTFPVVFFALLFWAAVFTVFFTMQGTTPLEFLFGRYEAPPPDVGLWKGSGVEAELGLLREERLLCPPGRPGSAYLLHQIRYRDPATRAITRVEPERRIRRRRVSVRPS